MNQDNPYDLPSGLDGIMAKAVEMQEKVRTAQERAGDKTVTGESGGGLVKVTANGRQEIVSVEIAPQLLGSEDLAMVQDLVTAAVNDALRRGKGILAAELGPLASMLKMGGIDL